jgi:DNA-binding CsgD family transcriptional regulator
MAFSAIAVGNCLQGAGRRLEAGPLEYQVYLEIARAGAPHNAAVVALGAAGLSLEFGEWHRCRSLLRDVLSARVDVGSVWVARLRSAGLAARSGQLSTAQQHLSRAEELAASLGLGRDPPALEFVDAATDVLAAAGRYQDVVAIVVTEIEAVAQWDPNWADALMARAAAATADWIERDPGDRDEAIARLDELEAARATAGPPSWPPAPGDPSPAAYRSLHDAHRSGAVRGHGGDADKWERSVQACDAAGLRWEAAQARYRFAAALLAQRRNRGEAGTLLREGLRIATDLGAEPLRADIEALALQAHISVADPHAEGRSREGAFTVNGLTMREQEVLGHVVAGRTYAEIATELFISEKTVSVHVSNLLRKTGTANRIELAALARRRSAGKH